MNRFAPFLWGMGVVGLVAILVTGAGAAGGVLPAPIILGVPLAGALVARRSGWARRGWSRRSTADAAWGNAAATAVGVGPAGPAAPGAVARALGRVEARDLVRSGPFGAGLGFCLMIVVLFGFVWAEDDNELWPGIAQLAPWFVHPLAGMAVLAGHRMATRSARDGTDELFEACPTPAATRTAGMLWTAVIPTVTALLFLALLGTLLFLQSPHLHGAMGLASAADAAGALVLGAGGLLLGVALGRWVRFPLVPAVAVIAIAFATTALNGIGGSGWNGYVGLSTAPTYEGPSPIFGDRPAGWHVLWLVALAAAVAGVARLRHDRGRTTRLVLAGAAIVALSAGVAVTRPMSSSAATRIAALVAHPEAHQDCADLAGPARLCVYEYHHELLAELVERVGPVSAALPSGLPAMTLRQAYTGELEDLPPEVRRGLRTADLERPAGELPLRFDWDVEGRAGDAGFDLATAALGLPIELVDEEQSTVVAGQARGVVVLWLGTRGLDHDDAVRAMTAVDPDSADPNQRGNLESDVCEVTSLTWSAQDLAAARSLLGRPEDEVQRAIVGDWARWSTPATSTDDLLSALGLPPVGPADPVSAAVNDSC